MLKLRQATVNDIEKIAEMKVENYYLTDDPVAHPELKKLFTQAFKKKSLQQFSDGMAMYILWEDQRMMGFMTYILPDKVHLPIEIRSIYIVPDRLGKSLGKLLSTKALEEFRKQSHQQAIVWLPIENEQIKQFYEKIGFVPTLEVMLREAVSLVEIKYLFSL